MLALSALVFAFAWWLGLYLAARDPGKPVLRLAALGLVGYALAVAADALRLSTAGRVSEVLGAVELFLVCQPGLAWLGVLLELAVGSAIGSAAGPAAGLAGGSAAGLAGGSATGSVGGSAGAPAADRTADRSTDQAHDHGPARRRLPFGWVLLGYAIVLPAVVVWFAGGVGSPVGAGHVVLVAAIAVPLLLGVALVIARRRALRPSPVGAVLAVATLFFGLGVAVLLLPFGLLPSWLALASIGFDLATLGLVVAVFDAFDEGQALRADMLRSLLAAAAVSVLFGGQVGVVLATMGRTPWLVALLFGSLAAAITVQVLAGPLASLLDRLAFAGSPQLRGDRARLRGAADALPRLAGSRLTGTGLDELDDEEFARLTRRALSHYGDLSRLVASPLTGLAVIDARLAARGAPDQPLERAAELKRLLAEGIQRLKPPNGEFGTSDEWRYFNALYFPYVVGVRPYSQRATAAGLDPVARRAWRWFATSVPQRSLHNWQNAAARLVADDLRARHHIDA